MKISELQALIYSKNFCTNDVTKCILGLNDVEVEIFCDIMEKECDVMELARKTKKSRATVQRVIINLMHLGIIGRRSKNTKRGRKYVYFAIDNKKLKEILTTRVDEYCRLLKKMVDLMK